MMQQGGRTWSIQRSVLRISVCLLLLAPALVTAQSLPPSSNQLNQQNQPGSNLQAPGTIPIPNPLAQQSAISSTASGASAPQSNTIPSSQGKSFGTIGQGLPGMTSGPTLTAPMGSQDPS
ncbi:MAG TPA: hypothetical protein PKX75_06975, partial [Nitrospira sp.]|nr:hypothetical protein [Nitrospira sp.]